MYDFVVILWIFILALVGMVLGCIVLCYIQSCIERLETDEKPDPPAEINQAEDLQSRVFYETKISDTLSKSGITLYTGTKKRNLNKPDQHPQPTEDNKQSEREKAVTTKIKTTSEMLIVAHMFRLAFDLVLFVITTIYPPSLWSWWQFFPTDSTVALGISFVGIRLLVSWLTIHSITLTFNMWTLKINKTDKPWALFRSDMRAVSVFPPLIMFAVTLYIFLRMVFLAFYGATLIDGWVFYCVLGVIDLLYFVFPLTLL